MILLRFLMDLKSGVGAFTVRRSRLALHENRKNPMCFTMRQRVAQFATDSGIIAKTSKQLLQTLSRTQEAFLIRF